MAKSSLAGGQVRHGRGAAASRARAPPRSRRRRTILLALDMLHAADAGAGVGRAAPGRRAGSGDQRRRVPPRAPRRAASSSCGCRRQQGDVGEGALGVEGRPPGRNRRRWPCAVGIAPAAAAPARPVAARATASAADDAGGAGAVLHHAGLAEALGEAQRQHAGQHVGQPAGREAHQDGKHPLQLYSLGTPNGVKVTVMLEELLAARPQRRRVRRLADQHRRGRPVRQRLRRDQSELEDPGAARPQRAEADPRLRVAAPS